MKKLLSILLALACVMTLAACGKKDDDHTTDPTPTPDPQPAVTTAEYTHGYVDMMLELPEGWSWENAGDNGTNKTEGIRFYKTDDPTVSYTLLCWTGGYGICGTGVTSEEITLANGMKVWQHTEEDTEKGTMVMADIFFEDVPGSYVASPSETMTTEVWNANRDALLSILGTAQIGRKSVSQQAAIDAAKAQYTGAYDQVYATYDVTSGAWTVSLARAPPAQRPTVWWWMPPERSWPPESKKYTRRLDKCPSPGIMEIEQLRQAVWLGYNWDFIQKAVTWPSGGFRVLPSM